MSKPLSYDAIFAALAVVALGSGCAKEAPKATAESVPAASAPGAITTATAAAPAPEQASIGAVAADPSPSAAPAPSVAGKPLETATKTKADKNTERNAAPPAPAKPKSVQAACGAGTCSADMKK